MNTDTCTHTNPRSFNIITRKRSCTPQILFNNNFNFNSYLQIWVPVCVCERLEMNGCDEQIAFLPFWAQTLCCVRAAVPIKISLGANLRWCDDVL